MENLIEDLKSDQEIINTCLFPFMMQFCMHKASMEDNKHYIKTVLIEVLGQEFATPLKNLPGIRRTKIKKRVYEVALKCIKAAPAADFKELCLAISIAMLNLIKEGALRITNPQTVEVSAKIIEEQLEYGDWGDLKQAKGISKTIIDEMRKNNCFRGVLIDGTST